MFILDWLLANIPGILAAFAAGYAFALTVVKLTPTKKDDEALEAVREKLEELNKVLPFVQGALPILKATLGAKAEKPVIPAADKPKA
jgi:hypothetical protein